jgi:hypothetical protein
MILMIEPILWYWVFGTTNYWNELESKQNKDDPYQPEEWYDPDENDDEIDDFNGDDE